MVTGAKVDDVVPPTIPAKIRTTIQSIKEIVGNHSDADIYVALKESNMDPNETTQKLLHQDPFHEVKRKRSRNKENLGNKATAEPVKNHQEKVTDSTSFDQNNQKGDSYSVSEKNQRGGYSQRGGHNQRGSGVRRGGEFKRGDDYQRGESMRNVVANHNNDSFQTIEGDQRMSDVQKDEVNQKDGDVEIRNRNFRDVRFQRGGSFQRGSGFYRTGGIYRGANFHRDGYARNPLPVKTREFRVVRDNRVNQSTIQDPSATQETSISNGEEASSNVSNKGNSSESLSNQKAAGVKGSSTPKVTESQGSDERRTPIQSINSQRQVGKSKEYRPRSAGQASNNSVLGVYSSSSDPVHVPSPARSAANGSFRREVGVVGVRKTPADNAGKQASANVAIAKSNVSAESVRPHVSPKGNQYGQHPGTEPIVPVMKVNRPFSSHNQHAQRSQQLAGHQKAVQKNKEWKPKSSQKSAGNAEVARLSSESALPAAEFASDGFLDSKVEHGNFSDKHSFQDNQGVIIADHIRVPDIERCRVTFGSFGLDTNLTDSIAESRNIEGAVESSQDGPMSLPVSASDASNVKVAAQESTESSASGAVVVQQISDSKDSSSPQNIENYAEIGMVSSDSTSYSPDLQKQHEAADTQSFSAYDPQTGYAVAYYRQPLDEARNDGLPPAQEGFNLHTPGMIPVSQALYHQQTQVSQMYPQVHVSHYMPYRQIMPPMYVPPMGMPGYSPNPAYAHPINGNGYMFMLGGTSHLNANALKYGAQPQFKPSPGGSPTGFGNYTTPNGYPVNAPGGMMGTGGVDDPSQVKYKDGNMYIQNPQAEAQEMWLQNSREMSGLQSSQYYNMQGQAPHGTYMPSHPGHHAAFNPAAAHSSHMQYPNIYHPQAAAISNPHHMPQTNVGLPQGAPMAQVGSYQQPQMNNHLQWTSNTF